MKHLPLRAVAAASILALVAACAPVTQRPALDDKAVAEEERKQRALAFQDLLEDQARLYRIAYPILARGAPLCADRVRASFGFRFASAPDVPKEYREVAAAALGLSAEIQIVQIAADSPAARAGLREKDIVLAIETKATPSGEGASERFNALLAEFSRTRKQVQFKLRRAGSEIVLPVEHEPVCDYSVLVNPADAINAFATGSQIVVMRGMLRFIRNDLELAVVVGHELAHNTMKHIDKQKGNMMLGTILDILAATRGVNTQGAFGGLAGMVFSKEFEAEADYVGLYFTARAGHDVTHAPNLWRRMASANPSGIQRGFMASHPSTPERFLSLEKVVAEIKAKQAAGKDLRPEIAP